MTAREKAQELVEKFKEFVHGYIGSSMLTNTEYPEQILSQSKKVAKIVVNEILSSSPTQPSEAYLEDWNDDHNQLHIEEAIQAKEYWQQVKNEIELL